jgi:type I restriction enzyme S subunit
VKKKHELKPKMRFPEFRDAWKSTKLACLGSFLGGGTPDTSQADYWRGTIPWISSSDVLEDDVNTLSATRFITERAISESATKLVPRGSVLFVSRVGTGKVVVSDRDVCTSQDFTNFVPNGIHGGYLGLFSLANKRALISLGQGTSIKGFSKDDLENFEVALPSVIEQKKSRCVWHQLMLCFALRFVR